MEQVGQQNNNGMIAAHLHASNVATSAGNHDVAMMQKVEIVALLPREEDQHRCNLMCTIGTVVINMRLFPLPQSIDTLKEKLLSNEDELCFVRATAALLLACHYEKLEDYPEAITYFDSTIRLCEAATMEERRMIIKKLDSSTQPAGKLFDQMKDVSHNHKNYWQSFVRAASGTGILSNVQPGIARELFGLHSNFRREQNLFEHPPTVNSDIMADVKSLPKSSKTYLIYQDGPIDDVARALSAFGKRITGLPAGPLSEEALARLRGDMAAEFGDDQWQTRVKYRAVEVNWTRFRAGKTTKVFKNVTMVICDPATSKHPKNLLSTFVVACQRPGASLPDEMPSTSPQRPQELLLTSKEDVNQTQVKLFLSMMGCDNVHAADPALLELLRKTGRTTLFRNYFQKQDNPHLSDMVKGKCCGHCKKVGPKLMLCACKKAYYCSKECQKSQWANHKKEHERVVAAKTAGTS